MGSLLDSIAEGINKAAVVLSCFSEAYSSSPYCKRETAYAVDRKKKILFVRVQPGYSLENWLALANGGQRFYDITGDSFLQVTKTIIEAIRGITRATPTEKQDGLSNSCSRDPPGKCPETHIERLSRGQLSPLPNSSTSVVNFSAHLNSLQVHQVSSTSFGIDTTCSFGNHHDGSSSVAGWSTKEVD